MARASAGCADRSLSQLLDRPLAHQLLPDRYLIKEIRANLMLGYIHDHFQPRIIHVLRHPCAVVASRTRLDWRVNLGDLLQQEDLLEDELAGLAGDIGRARSDSVASHAIGWAVESRVAGRQLRERSHFRVHYERLVSEPEASFLAMLKWRGLGGDGIDAENIRRSSHTKWRGGKSQEGRHSAATLSSWKKQLSQEEQRVVLDWAHRLGWRITETRRSPSAPEVASALGVSGEAQRPRHGAPWA